MCNDELYFLQENFASQLWYIRFAIEIIQHMGQVIAGVEIRDLDQG